MIKGLVQLVSTWCLRYLIGKGISVSYKTPEFQIVEVNLNTLTNLERQLSNLRFEIIKKYGIFHTEIEGVYLTLLAKSNDSLLQTTMTESWYETYRLFSKYFDRHTELVEEIQKITTQLEELNKKK